MTADESDIGCRAEIEVVGHRGAGSFREPNTLAAFEIGLRLGCHRLECDVRRTSDGTLVLLHDEVMEDDTGGRYQVHRTPFAQLRNGFDGLMTFAELAEFAGSTPLMIDLKSAGFEADIAREIRRFGLERTSNIATTHAVSIRRLRRELPSMELCLSTGHLATGNRTALGRNAIRAGYRQGLPLLLPGILRWCGANGASLQHHVASQDVVDALRGSGNRVFVWTADFPADIERSIGLRPDGIISNRPDLVFQGLSGRKHAEI